VLVLLRHLHAVLAAPAWVLHALRVRWTLRGWLCGSLHLEPRGRLPPTVS